MNEKKRHRRNNTGWIVSLLRRRRRANGGGVRLPLRLALAILLALPLAVGALMVSGIGTVAAVYAQYSRNLPPAEEVAYRSQVAFKTTKIYDRTGKVLLFEIFDPQGGNRTVVPLERITPHMRQATIAIEDRDFYTNPGVNLRGLARAAWWDLTGRDSSQRPQGGSSITQQLVRNVLMSPEERFSISPARKIKETILALEVSLRFSKDQILEWYLNTIPYGNSAYGVQAAAEAYFGKNVEDLTLAEAAMLAILPQAPAANSPLEHPAEAKKRQELTLDAMWREGYISLEELRTAKAEVLHPRRQRFEIIAPHFVMYVRQILEQRYGPDLLYRGGLKVITTVDLETYRIAEEIAQEKIAELEKEETNAHNAAVVVLDPTSGQVLAILGSIDYFNEEIDGQVNVATAPRQPGSAIKPFTYAEAFNQGYTPATMILDVRTSFPGDPVPYSPENYDRRYHGPVLIRQALACSYNIPTVRVLDMVGVNRVLYLARRMGINTLERDTYGLSLTLGGGEVTLLDMTYAFGLFANGGVMAGRPVPEERRRAGFRELDPVFILSVEDAQGNVLEEYAPKSVQTKEVLRPQVAYLINDILSDNGARIPAFGADNKLQLSRLAAAKTGTTNDWRDAWTIGYTPQLVTGVWVGNSSGEPMKRVPGSRGAAPIWHDIMEKLLAPLPVVQFSEPEGLERVQICSSSGLLPTEYCPHRRTEVFIKGTAPTAHDDVNRPFRICKPSGKLATIYCPPDQVEEKVFQIYPPEAADWIRENEIPQPPREYDDTFGPAVGSAELAIISPSPYSFVTGVVTVPGRMKVPGADYYRLEYGQGLDPSAWIQIGPNHHGEVDGEILENWDVSGLDGLYTLQLTVARGDGSLEQTSIQVTVDNLPPSIHISYPRPGASFSRQGDEWVSIQAQAQDNASLDRVEFFVDEKLIGTSTVSYHTKWRLRGATSGSHILHAVAYDAAGNATESERIPIRIW